MCAQSLVQLYAGLAALKIRDVLSAPGGTTDIAFFQEVACKLLQPVIVLLAESLHHAPLTAALLEYLADEWREGQVRTGRWLAHVAGCTSL